MAMQISYSRSFENAWSRMNLLLFQPFILSRWIGLGFTAFLANLETEGGSSGSRWSRDMEDFNYSGIDDVFSDSYNSARDFLTNGITGLILAIVIIGILFFIILFTWLSSRGHFMFLDNLVHRRSEVRRPWRELGHQADSLFVWRLVFSLVALALVGGGVILAVLVIVPMVVTDAPGAIALPFAVIGGTMAFMFLVALCYVDFFLIHFVVPIMYRHRVSASRAWRFFLAVFQQHPGHFILYGLFFLLVGLIGMLAYFLGGVLTCCVGLLLLVIPYVSSVLTLPLFTLLRYMDLEFLNQFGEHHRIDLGPATASDTGDHPYQSDDTSPSDDTTPDDNPPGEVI